MNDILFWAESNEDPPLIQKQLTKISKQLIIDKEFEEMNKVLNES